MAFATACAVLLLASHTVSAQNNGWSFWAKNKQDAIGKSSVEPDSNTLNQWWDDFKQTYNRNYDATQDAAAKAVFVINMLNNYKINRNASIPYWKSGNKFSDISEATLKAKMLMKYNPLTTSPSGRKLTESERAFTEVQTATNPGRRLLQTRVKDWRAEGKVTAVADQAQCGCCWAFSATAAIESAYLISNGITASTNYINLSEQQLVSCATSAAGYNSDGCNGGSSDGAISYVLNVNQTTEAVYGYTSGAGVTGTCSSVVTSTVPGQTVKLGAGAPVYYTRYDEAALRAAVDIQPVVAYFDVASSFYGYAGGVYAGTDCINTNINHAMLVVGYSYSGNPASDYWILKNSWGPNWGLNGYVYVAMDGTTNGRCGLYLFNTAPSLSFVQSLGNTLYSPPPPSPSPRPPAPSPSPPKKNNGRGL